MKLFLVFFLNFSDVHCQAFLFIMFAKMAVWKVDINVHVRDA